jgi:hypothetical protein
MTRETANKYKEKLYNAFNEWRGFEEQYDFVFVVSQILMELLNEAQDEEE